MGDYIVIGVVGVFVILMSVLPKPVYNLITRAFSMQKNGIRKVRRYHTTTDSIANLLIGVSIIFCVFYSILFRSIYDLFCFELFMSVGTGQSSYI